MKAICLPRRNRPSFWASCSSRLTFFLKWEFWLILFNAEAIFASSISKFEKSEPLIDRDDFKKLSTVSTISTTSIHNIVSEGESEQALTWVFNVFFQHENVEGVDTVMAVLIVSREARHCRRRNHDRRPSGKTTCDTAVLKLNIGTEVWSSRAETSPVNTVTATPPQHREARAGRHGTTAPGGCGIQGVGLQCKPEGKREGTSCHGNTTKERGRK